MNKNFLTMTDIDDDDYVTIGTPFDVPEDNEPLPKASKVEDQIATDSKGRRRFHGAFTGGFSAGYFNTVGSKEGWAPSTFKSSRSKKNENENSERVQYKPEDFMDEDDFAEHGIAPKKLKTAFNLSNSNNDDASNERASFLRAVNNGEIHSPLPGSADLLVDMLAPPKHSVGIKLLNKMGWKQGQGVGEKLDLSNKKDDENPPVKKLYGCALPPASKNTDIKNTFKMMLAPKDVQPVSFTKKDNFHGIGYSGIITSETRLRTTAENSDHSFRPTGKEKKGIRGQAFGIGVFEEEDDDIYGVSSMSNYNMMMTEDNGNRHGWTGSMSKPKVNKDCLPGFKKSLKKLTIKVPSLKIQASMEIPRHVFLDDKKTVTTESSNPLSKLTSQDRSDLLGETMKSLDSVKHWTLKWDQKGDETRTSSVVEPKEIPVASQTQQKVSRWDKNIEIVKPKKNSLTASNEKINTKEPTSKTKNDVFQPFSRYPEKQARYETYLDAIKKCCKPELKYDSLMTEWEKEQELAEFARAATMYKPLTSSMACRFVRANFVGSKDSKEVKIDNRPDDKKAAEMGMHGKLTRKTLDWHPDLILCKRMNIPNPYPNSRLKGVPSRNKKQTSFFSDSFLDRKKSIEPPDKDKYSNDNDDNEDDEFFSRIQKNKQKLLKSKSGPLSHLNIKLDSNKQIDAENNDLNKEENSEIEKEVVVKPSIDIFKAIFENSDSENSNVDAESEKTSADETNLLDVDTKKNELVEDESNKQISDQDIRKDSLKKKIEISKYYEEDKKDSVMTERKETLTRNDPYNKHYDSDNRYRQEQKHKRRKKEKKHKKHKSRTYSDDNSDSETDYKYRKKKQKESDAENSHKSKKKKKSKYKSDDSDKDTEERSKKKKLKRNRQSSSSSKEGSPTPSNAVLLEKLKKFSQARPKAADFM